VAADPTPEQAAEPGAEVRPVLDPTNRAVRLARAEWREQRAAEARERDRRGGVALTASE
jgi:hypothetical protein